MESTQREIDFVTKLYEIFSLKKWHSRVESNDVFKNYLSLLTNLEAEQRELILDLTIRYLWISSDDYQSLLFETLDKLDEVKVNNSNRIVALPIIKPEDVGKVKSSSPLLYLLKGFAILSKPLFAKKNIEIVENVADIHNNKFKINQDDLILLIDDFLGSGETINAALAELLKNCSIIKENIIVVSLVALRNSTDFLDSIDVSYCINIVLSKAISEYYKSPEKEKKISIMEEIEKMIPSNHFQFGYNGSEALVTMIRTPDNTFPIFWKKYKKNDKIFLPPFMRYNE